MLPLITYVDLAQRWKLPSYKSTVEKNLRRGGLRRHSLYTVRVCSVINKDRPPPPLLFGLDISRYG